MGRPSDLAGQGDPVQDFEAAGDRQFEVAEPALHGPLDPEPAPDAPAADETEDFESPSPGSIQVDLGLAPRRVALWLSGCALTLVVCHVITVVWHYEFDRLPWVFRGLFDLDEEESFGTWFSSGLLMLAGLGALLCGHRARALDGSLRYHWWFLGLGFVLLSIDEVAGLHESLNTVTEMSWAVPGGMLAVLVGLSYLRFLIRLPRRTALLFVIAGAIYVGGAVGVELATEGYQEADQLDTLEYNLTTALEEGMEMGGIVIFLFALLAYIAPRKKLQVRFEMPGSG